MTLVNYYQQQFSVPTQIMNLEIVAGHVIVGRAARWLSLLLLLTLPVAGWAQYDYVTNNGKITITGYTDFGGAAIIPGTIDGRVVTSIGDGAFAGSSGLTSVVLPGSIASIGFNAFSGCSKLTNVTLGGSVSNIGDYAFSFCTSLTNVTFPNSVTRIGSLAFYACTSLTRITIPNRVTHLENSVFYACTSLTNVTISDSVTNLGDSAFENCSSLTGVYFRGDAPGVGINVFAGDNGATAYFLPETTGWGPSLGDLPTAVWNMPATPPAMALQPTDVAVTVGSPATFRVAISGSLPLFYQWRKDGLNLSASNHSTFTIASAQLSDVGQYSVVVTNDYGSVTSAVAGLTVILPPTIIAQPLSRVLRPGQSAQLLVQAGGTEPLRYRWTKNGVTVAGASNAVYAIHSVSVSQAGKYQVIVTNVMGSVTSALAILTVDGVKPSLTILKPLPNARVSNDTVLVTGKVADTGGPLAGVYYQVNNAPWQTAGGTTNWQTTVTNLLAGTNLIRVYAKDTAENYSLTNTLKVNYVVTNLLLVLNGGTGLGKVTPYTNSLLEVGKNYSLTAAPLTGSLFSNWVCGGVVLTNKAVLQYTLRSNTTLVANFVTNAFLSRKGDYAGLFCPSTDVSMADWTNSGAVKLTVTDKGTFTGQLTYQGKGYPLSGALGLGGMTNLVILRGKDPALQIGLALDLGSGGEVSGTVQQNNLAWTSDLWADQVLKQAQKANYTILVETGPGGTNGGNLTLAVQPTGTVTLGGTLSDKTKLTGSLPLTRQQEVVMCQTLYSGKGMWLGYVRLVGTNRGGQAHWQKLPNRVDNSQGFSVNPKLLLP